MDQPLQLALWQNYGTSYTKKSQVEVLPDVYLVADWAKNAFLWAMQHRWRKRGKIEYNIILVADTVRSSGSSIVPLLHSRS